MNHDLGPIAFSIADDWRDTTTYTYASPPGDASMQVELAPEAADAASVLALGRKAYEAYLKPVIVYSRDTTVTGGDGSKIPAVEGEQRDLNAPTTSRFAMAPLVSGAHKALVTFLSPPRPDFVSYVRTIVAASSHVGAPSPPPPMPAGMERRQASFIYLPVPRGWDGPRVLRFLDPDWDSVAIRVSIAEPFVPEGDVKLALELPGRLEVESAKTNPVDREDLAGWVGDWVVRATGAQVRRALVRKASVHIGRDVVATLYGKAPADLADHLEKSWSEVWRTLRRGAGV